MSRSYDRSPPQPPGGGRGQGDDYDAFYDAYEEQTGRPTAPQSRDAGRAGTGARMPAQPMQSQSRDFRGPLSPQELTAPPRPRPRPPEALETGYAKPVQPQREMYAPARTQKRETEQANAPIVPAGSVTGKSLTLVISIMCFLACLTAGAVYMMNQSASAWLRDIASEVTVQIEPREKADTEKVLRDVVQFLGKQPGIRNARPLAVEESAGLLEPWLGSSEALKSLPVPRLISLELDRYAPPDFEALRGNLTKQFKGVTLDDHRQWQQQIRTVTRSFALGGIAILLLVAAATTAIIISATRAAMASNREIVEVLHFVGATDRFIAREFERNFMRVGIRAGLIGALAAMAVFTIMPTVMELLGGGSVSLAEMQRLVGTGSLDLLGYGVLAGLVVVVAILCRFTSRFSVNRILHSKN
jgi:cell division transport system permease protein